MKRIFTLLLLLLISSRSWTQVLSPASLNLNPGGVIHDVAYDSYYDAYVVVGSFSTINGQARNNLAFIDASTLTVMSQAPIASIDGVIRSVEVVNYVPHSGVPGPGFRNYIYLGGNFTTVNADTKVALTRLRSTHYYAQPPTGGVADYTLQTNWNAQIIDYSSFYSSAGVHDLLVSGDTLIACGHFINSTASYLGASDPDINAIALDATATTFLRFPMFSSGTSFITGSGTADPFIRGVRKVGSRYFLFGRDDEYEIIHEYNSNGIFIQNIESCGSENTVYDFEIHPSSVDTVLFSYEEVGGGLVNDRLVSYLLNGNLHHCPTTSTTTSIFNYPSMGLMRYFDTYEDFVFTSNASQLLTSKRNGLTNVPILKTINLNGTWMNGYPALTGAPCLKRVENLLFLSSNSLSTVDGTPRSGFAVFCLEPTPAAPFTQSDPSACEEDISIYTIPQAQCADGYHWTYTGTGALYRITGSASAWTSLTSAEIAGTNANSIEVYFPIGSTGGTLSVAPYTQFSATEKTFSQGQNIAISINPKPDVILPSTHTLNCYSDTTILVAQTSNPNPSFEWAFNGTTLANDSLLITINDPVLLDSVYYVMTITDAITGCFNTDSTFFYKDLSADQIDANLTTTNPPVWTCSTTSMTINSNQTNYIVHWENAAGTSFPDPFTITSAPNGVVYDLHGIQISNGCPTQDQFGAFTIDMTQADGTLVGYNYVGGGTAIDTLTCNNPSITIQCAVTAPFASNSTAEWLDGSGTPTGSDILTLSESDVNGSTTIARQFRTLNNDNGCTQIYNVLVRDNFAQPSVGSLADQSLNCSHSEILLTHPLNGSANVIEGWLDGSGTQTASDTITATTVGNYIYEVQSTLNGCSNYDTVSVLQTFDLLLDMPHDTLICPDELVTITPTVIGNTETPTYLWSTGATNPSETATGGVDSMLIVTVTTPSGCTGTDSTWILISEPVHISVTPFIACTDGSLEITNVTGGEGNYQHSIDGSTWTDSTNFSGLAFGTYSVYVQDDLGCIYDTTALLDGNAMSVAMSFAASTYNAEGDTIVLVNTTSFTGLDSVYWNLPPSADVIYLSDSIVILSMATSGWHDVELIGYLDTTCEFSYVNPVFFGDHAPFFDDSTFFNGIDSLSVFPNPLNISGGNDLITVYIEFGKTQNYTILITNTLGQPIPSMSITSVGEIVSHQLTFPTGTAAGTYRVHIIADYDARQEQITLY